MAWIHGNIHAPSHYELLDDGVEDNPALGYYFNHRCDNAFWGAILKAYRGLGVNHPMAGILAFEEYTDEAREIEKAALNRKGN